MKGTLEEFGFHVRKTVIDAESHSHQVRFHELRIFGEMIKKARLDAGWTLVEAAARLGVSLMVYRSLEKGNRLPSFSDVRGLEELFWRQWPLLTEPEGYVLSKGITLCEWEEDQFGIWETGCGNSHEFHTGGPKENGYLWCPYCGSSVSETGFFEKQEEEDEDE